MGFELLEKGCSSNGIRNDERNRDVEDDGW